MTCIAAFALYKVQISICKTIVIVHGDKQKGLEQYK